MVLKYLASAILYSSVCFQYCWNGNAFSGTFSLNKNIRTKINDNERWHGLGSTYSRSNNNNNNKQHYRFTYRNMATKENLPTGTTDGDISEKESTKIKSCWGMTEGISSTSTSGRNSTNSTESLQDEMQNQNPNDISNMIENGISSVEVMETEEREYLPFSREIDRFLSKPINEILSALLVILSSFLVAVGTLPQLPSDIYVVNLALEDVVTYLFAFDFFFRWYGQGQMSMKYLTRPFSLLDIVITILPLFLIKVVVPLFGTSAMPSWLMSNSGLINLRLLRIIRLQRVLTDMETFTKFELALGLRPSDVRPWQLQLARVLLSLFTLLSVATGFIYAAEHEVNPLIPDYFTALYFGLTTLTTVGFGDITPVTFNGRLVVCGSILAGVAVVPAQAASLVEALLDLQTERKAELKNVDDSSSDSSSLSSSSLSLDGAETERKVFNNNNNGISDDRQNIDKMVDTVVTCSVCGVASHRTDASYCWGCGSKFCYPCKKGKSAFL